MVDVDIIYAQVFEAIGSKVFYRGGSPIYPVQPPSGARKAPNLTESSARLRRSLSALLIVCVMVSIF